ncbi:hypothetical protein Ga0074812_10359 [Parafrankia irregularis]|uniref:Uncharacterized protein n=1 Tax=Parafrankia irregularis TaxID=795642 RepID=A0A0S4QH38_9ACTN|nr:hypothetical protein Ga0074812_10359 [Parafrankia irregularis]
MLVAPGVPSRPPGATSIGRTSAALRPPRRTGRRAEPAAAQNRLPDRHTDRTEQNA